MKEGTWTPSQDISRHLHIHPPTQPDKAPAMVSLERERELEIPWFEVISRTAQEQILSHELPDARVNEHPLEPETDLFGEEHIEKNQMRRYFESSWRIMGVRNPSQPNEAEHALLAERALVQRDGFIFQPSAGAGEESQVQSGFFLTLLHHPSGRIMAALDANDQPLDLRPPPLDQWQDWYANLWQQIFTLTLVYDSSETALKNATSAEYVSRETLVIKRDFDRLNNILKLGSSLEEKALGLAGDSFEAWWNDRSALDEGINRFADFTQVKARAEDGIRDLATRAQDIGYYLHTSADTQITYPSATGQKPVDLIRGELYQTRSQTFAWTTFVTRYRTVVRRGRSGRRRLVRQAFRVPRNHRFEATLYQKVPTDRDPVEQKIQQVLGQEGAPFRHLYRIRKASSGYRAESGENLRDIMYRCEMNEDFRMACVLVLYETESLVSDQLYDTGASFIYRPLPGMTVSEFPSAYLLENLSYTLQWKNVELGQLVATMNLSPGEERSVTLTKSFRDELSVSSSFQETIETASSQSNDFASEIERETQKEFSKKSTRSASGSAGFSYAGFNVGAKASGSSTTSLRNFARTMQKVARKAARSVSRKTAREISSSTTRTTTVSNDQTTNFTVRNINQGRTLNLMFYQLNNHFKGGLYLDDLRLVVTEGRELVQGTGIYDFFIYETHELEEAMTHFSPRNLPVWIDLENETRVARYWDVLMRTMIDLLEDEYNETSTVTRKNKLNQLSSCGLVCMEPSPTQVQMIMAEEDETETEKVITALRENNDLRAWFKTVPETLGALGEKSECLREVLQSLAIQATPLVPDELIVASGGLYVDALVGEMPATEPYSEEMRDLEKAQKEAEVAKIRAEGEEIRARTNALYVRPEPPPNAIETIKLPLAQVVQLDLRFELLQVGSWIVRYGNLVLPVTLEKNQNGAKFDWQPVGPLQSLPSLLNLYRNLHMENPVSGERIYPVGKKP